uniref:Secreted protein n=1 Tax=Favella ehrenbergii TaxID=182087 RepID=A0A7S3I7B4_9SPIT
MVLSVICYSALILGLWVVSLRADRPSTAALLRGLLVDDLDLDPFSVGVFAHNAHLVVAAGDGEHVADLAPAHFPKRHVLLEPDLLSQLPHLLVSLAHPHFASCVL